MMEPLSQLEMHLPKAALQPVADILARYTVDVSIKNSRKTKHGDYQHRLDGTDKITLNKTDNPYRFLITLIHELAHLVAFKKFGFAIKPHGKEWKDTYTLLMLPFLKTEIFPDPILRALAKHMKNPKASTDRDFKLVMLLKAHDKSPVKTYIFELPEGAIFKIYNGKEFIKGSKKRTRYECLERATNRRYMISPHAEVALVDRTEEN